MPLLKKISLRWVGFQKSYVIFRVGHGKCLCWLTRWVGGVKKGQKYAYVIFEWSLIQYNNMTESEIKVPQKRNDSCLNLEKKVSRFRFEFRKKKYVSCQMKLR